MKKKKKKKLTGQPSNPNVQEGKGGRRLGPTKHLKSIVFVLSQWRSHHRSRSSTSKAAIKMAYHEKPYYPQ